MSSTKSKPCTDTRRIPRADADQELLDAFDEMILAASRGDRRAIGCLAIAYVTPLLDEARAALGPLHEQLAADVVQEFLLGLAEARFAFPCIRGCAIPWMKRTVRAMAEERLRALGLEAA